MNENIINNEVSKAREFSFLGKYKESLDKYKKSLELVNNIYLSCKQDNLKKQWFNLKSNISNELINCKNLYHLIYEGINIKKKVKIKSDLSIKKINNKLPFNQVPFIHHTSDNFNSTINISANISNNNLNIIPKNIKNYYYKDYNKDPDVWDEPTLEKIPIKNKIIKKKKYNDRNNNIVNKDKSKRNYDKPWSLPKNNEEKNRSYLYHCYPDGNGPDSELIKMIEKNIITMNPDVKFSEIAGHDKAKSLLNENVLMPLKMKNFFSGIRKPSRGVLLYGPPGTGKTMLAKAVATTGKTKFFIINPSTIASKWRGDSEKWIRIIFEMAYFYAPTTIFIDEIDSMLSERSSGEHESNRKVKTQFFIEIDGVHNKTEVKDANGNIIPKNVWILAATNRPWDLDEAILRRLNKRIYIPLPNNKSRKLLFELKLKELNLSNDIDWDYLVEKTHGFNADDIENLCHDAAMIPLRDFLKGKDTFNIDNLDINEEELLKKEISMNEMKIALNNVKSSSSEKFLQKYVEWTENFSSV